MPAPLARPAVTPPGSREPARAGRIVLTLGLLLHALAHLYVVASPMARREAPVEPDDAYTYLWKAAQLGDCPLQECEALVSLRPQLLAPSTDPETAWLRYREYTRLFLVSNPLHSLLLYGLHLGGLSWEVAYGALAVIGALFLTLALGFWLCSLLGPGAAGAGLALSALVVFPGQGLNYIVPGNLALGLAFLTWGAMLRWRRSAGWWVAAGVLAMVAMHPVGRLYAVVTIVAFLVLEGLRAPRAVLPGAAAGALIVGAAFVLPLVIDRPDLRIAPDPPPAGWDVWSGYAANLQRARGMVGGWMSFYGGPLVALPLAAAGALATPPARRRPVAAFGALLGALSALSLFHLLPRYPAELFGRIWVALALLFTGFVGQLAWRRFGRPAAPPAGSGRDAAGVSRGRPGRGAASRGGAVTLVLLGALLAAGVSVAIKGGRSVYKKAARRAARQQVALDPAQPRQLLAASGPSDVVLYMDEVPMHFYLTRGASRRKAMFHPGFARDPEGILGPSGVDAVRFVAAWNPIQSLPSAHQGGLELGGRAAVEVTSRPPRPLASLALFLENRGPGARLIWSALDESGARDRVQRAETSVPPRWSGWVGYPGGGDAARGTLLLEVADPEASLWLGGVRVDPDASLRWPWDEGITLAVKASGEGDSPAEVEFSTSRLWPPPEGRLRVLSDGGSTVLAEVDRSARPRARAGGVPTAQPAP